MIYREETMSGKSITRQGRAFVYALTDGRTNERVWQDADGNLWRTKA